MYVLLQRPMILIDAAVVGFHCNVTSCGLALVKAEPTAEAKFGVCGRGNAVGLTSILDRVQFFLLLYCSASRYTS